MSLLGTSALAADPPWWSSGLFLIGGALIAFAATFLTKQRELSRADRARWDIDILDGTIRIIDTIEAIHLDLMNHRDLISPERFLAHESDIREAQAVCKKFRLIASPTMGNLAREISAAMELGLHAARDDTAESPGKLRSLVSEARNKAGALHDNARIELRGTTDTNRRRRKRISKLYDTYYHPFEK